MHALEHPQPDPIADVEFRVFFNQQRGCWTAEQVDSEGGRLISHRGHGSTPITALMGAEAKARKGAR